MPVRYRLNSETMKMEEIKGRKGQETERIAIPSDLYVALKKFAKEDGMSFKGISYLTVKDENGKTKKDKDGKPIFQLDKDGNKKSVEVEESVSKVNSAVALYVIAAVQIFVAQRRK